MKLQNYFLLTVFCISFPSYTQLRLPPFFTDHMVLQRDHLIPIQGKGTPKSSIVVRFGSEQYRTQVLQDSTWRVILKKQQANTLGQALTIKNKNEQITLNDVLVGDLWLCIGQSNMEWPLKNESHYNEELNAVRQPLLRFYNTTYAGKNSYNQKFTDSLLKLLNPKDFYQGKWEVSNPKSAPEMSAVGYYFGKKILQEEEIPIGLIHMAIGGAPIEAFIRPQTLRRHPLFKSKMKGNWLYNEALPVWIRERGIQNLGDLNPLHKNTEGPHHAFQPGFAYTAGIKPLSQIPIKGILWYQGESNAQEKERVLEYNSLQKLMIDDFRAQWKQPKLPFYWVQLSSIDSTQYKSHFWPEFRNEQRKALDRIAYGGMAVSSDVGSKNDVHPRNKKEIGNRLARWALNKTYKKEVLPSGPLPKEALFKNGKIIVTFHHFGKELQTSDGSAVRGFSIDKKTKLEAVLRKAQVELFTKTKPEFIYYGWQPFSTANLVNSENLPTSTFKLKVK